MPGRLGSSGGGGWGGESKGLRAWMPGFSGSKVQGIQGAGNTDARVLCGVLRARTPGFSGRDSGPGARSLDTWFLWERGGSYRSLGGGLRQQEELTGWALISQMPGFPKNRRSPVGADTHAQTPGLSGRAVGCSA